MVWITRGSFREKSGVSHGGARGSAAALRGTVRGPIVRLESGGRGARVHRVLATLVPALGIDPVIIAIADVPQAQLRRILKDLRGEAGRPTAGGSLGT